MNSAWHRIALSSFPASPHGTVKHFGNCLHSWEMPAAGMCFSRGHNVGNSVQ